MELGGHSQAERKDQRNDGGGKRLRRPVSQIKVLANSYQPKIIRSGQTTNGRNLTPPIITLKA